MYVLAAVSSLLKLHGAPGDTKWEFQTAGLWRSTPAVGIDGTIYTADKNGRVYAVNANGQEKWHFQAGNACLTSPAIGANGTVHVGAAGGKVYAIRSDGQRMWESQVGHSPYPGIDLCDVSIGRDGTLYRGTMDGNVHALDGMTGELKWEFQTGGWAVSSPAIGTDGTLYVLTMPGGEVWAGKVFALDGATGAKHWEVTVAYSNSTTYALAPSIGSDGTVYVGSMDGRVYALDGASGKEKWVVTIGNSFPSSPTIGGDGTLYLDSLDGEVLALDGATGAKKWQTSTDGACWFSPIIGSDDTVYVLADYVNTLFALDGATGQKKWAFPTQSQNSGATLGGDGTVYLACGYPANKLYALASTSSGGLAKSRWPKHQRNARNTGQMPSSPSFGNSLDSEVILEGAYVNFAMFLGGEPPPRFQWFFNDRPLAAGTNANYEIESVSSTNEGTYMLVASNELGSATNGPATIGINNVTSSNVFGLILRAPVNTPMQLLCADRLTEPTPWRPLTSLALSATPYVFIDSSATATGQRFYRATSSVHLEAWDFPTWTFTAPAASQWQIEFVDAQLGFTNWQFLTNLTLPNRPFQFIDTTATNHWPRFYRTRPL